MEQEEIDHFDKLYWLLNKEANRSKLDYAEVYSRLFFTQRDYPQNIQQKIIAKAKEILIHPDENAGKNWLAVKVLTSNHILKDYVIQNRQCFGISDPTLSEFISRELIRENESFSKDIINCLDLFLSHVNIYIRYSLLIKALKKDPEFASPRIIALVSTEFDETNFIEKWSRELIRYLRGVNEEWRNGFFMRMAAVNTRLATLLK